MTTALTGAVELLERSLGYTRVVLSGVTTHHLDRPTPCDDWDLSDLLAHMEDGLDAFSEAADGRVDIQPGAASPGAVPQVVRLQSKACALLGAWAGQSPSGVHVAGHPVPSDLLVGAAALEITVHGWDVGRALGSGPPLPDELAARLLPVARELLRPEDRTVRFGPAQVVELGAGPGRRLLAFLGR